MVEAYIHSIAHYLPEQRLTNADLTKEYPDWSMEKIASKTGIIERRVAAEQCASDLAIAAAQNLFDQSPEVRSRIDTLIFCTQSPDYLLPATACTIQDRLNLPTTTAALDVNQGCSGYVYGLGLSKGLIETGQSGGVLLLNADTYSKMIPADDRSARTLFGDAGAATFIDVREANNDAPALGPFCYGTDGSGADHLIVRNGGFRSLLNSKSESAAPSSGEHKKPPFTLYMNGPEVFSFALKRVPGLVNDVLTKARLKREEIDYFVFHQANQHMLQTLCKKCEIPPEKFFICLEKTGNTVSATIPIALCSLNEQVALRPNHRILLVGFGVGYSWGAAIIQGMDSVQMGSIEKEIPLNESHLRSRQ